MANNSQNLRRINTEQAREMGKKGGKASAEARRKKKELKEIINLMFEQDVKIKDGSVVSCAEAIAKKQMEKALKGDTKAFEVLRDTAGQKPVDKVMVAEVDQAVIDEVEKMVFEEDETGDN